MKKIPVQVKIGLLMTMAVVLLSATGYLSYRNISSIVSSIHVDVNPEMRLLSIREISADLQKAENSIRIFTITNDKTDLKPYYRIISNIDLKVASLRAECINDPVLLEQADTISTLIEENIALWNELLILNYSDKVVEELKQISDQLDSASVEEPVKEKGILKRVFSRNKESNENEPALISNLKKQELIENINKIEEHDKVTKEKMLLREAQLAVTGGQLKEQFYDLITKMENEVTEMINTKSLAANILADKTYRWITMFSLSGTLLAIIVMFIIVRFVRKTSAYQVALLKSRDEAEKLARTKELFVANMSHEIRTPVTAISGFTEQLLHEPHNDVTTKTLQIIKSSSDHLAKIINDILDFSKLQNEKLVLEKVHFRIKQILEDVYALFEGEARRNSTTLSFSLSPDTPAVVLGDPYRLKQIFINLVSNSVKFTLKGKVHYSVKVIINQLQEVELILEVTDTGIGIEESKLGIIFEDFTQAEMSITRQFGGTGLGLSIVRKLVDLHKGTIECRSRINQGTEFTIKIPYRAGDENLIKHEVKSPLFIPDEVRNLKILIVDDEEYNRLLFKMILDRWKIRYDEAVNGIEAVEMVKAGQYDMIFMDARMPGKDGLTATRIIREELNITVPVICISAASLNEEWGRYSEAGMNAFLLKPFTEEILLNSICNVLDIVDPISHGKRNEGKEEMQVTTEVVNLRSLYHLAGGDEQFVKQMLLSFLDTTGKGLNELVEAAFRDQSDLVAEIAHRLSPPCRHIGAIKLGEILKTTEDSIRKGKNKTDIGLLAEESVKEFNAIKEVLNREISKIG